METAARRTDTVIGMSRRVVPVAVTPTIVSKLRPVDRGTASVAAQAVPMITSGVTEAFIAEVVEEGRRIAEQSAAHNKSNGHKLRGAEKQRIAMDHIKKRISALNATVDLPLIAVRLESSIQKEKEQK